MNARLAVWVPVLALALTRPLGAQVRPESIPADALVYLEWPGLDAVTARTDTHLGALMPLSGLDEALRALPELLPRLSEGMDEPELAMILSQLPRSLSSLLRQPGRLYLGPPTPGAEPPVPRMALILDAGEQAEGVEAELQQQLVGAAPIGVHRVGGSVVLCTHDVEAATLLQQAGQGLGALPRYQRAAWAGSQLALWVDAQGIVELIDTLSDGDRDWRQVRDVLGLKSLDHLLIQAGFAGQSWHLRADIAAPGPREGLLGLLGDGALSPESLLHVPATAAAASGLHLDVEKALMAALQIAEAVDPPSPEEGSLVLQAEVALDEMSQQLGVDLRQDLLGALGSDWMVYADRSIGGSDLMGSVLTQTPRDATALRRTLSRLSGVGNQWIANAMLGAPIRMELREQTVQGVDLFCLQAPFAAPCIAFHEGRLYAALFPGVAVAAALAGVPEHSIAGHAQLAALMEVETAAPSSFFVRDVAESLRQHYASSMMLSQMLTGGADAFGVQMPLMALPTLPQLLGLVEPSASVSFSDAGGWHLRITEAFPGATVLLGESSSINGVMSPLSVLPMMLFSVGMAAQRMDAQLMELGYVVEEAEVGAMISPEEEEIMVEEIKAEEAEEAGGGGGAQGGGEGGGGAQAPGSGSV